MKDKKEMMRERNANERRDEEDRGVPPHNHFFFLVLPVLHFLPSRLLSLSFNCSPTVTQHCAVFFRMRRLGKMYSTMGACAHKEQMKADQSHTMFVFEGIEK